MAIRYNIAPVRIEGYPKVSATLLRRLGLFEDDVSIFKGLKSHDQPFIVSRVHPSVLTFFHQFDADRVHLQEILIEYRKEGSVCKPYFHCPVTNKRCRELLLLNGYWASRKGHGLRIRNGTTTQRKRERVLKLRDTLLGASNTGKMRAVRRGVSELHELLREIGYIPDPLQDVGDVVQQAAHESQKSLRNSLRSVHPSSRSLEEAILTGASARGSFELGMYLNRRTYNSISSKIPALVDAPRAIALQDDHMALDLNTLRTADLFVPGEARTRILNLPGLVGEADRAIIVVNLKRAVAGIDILYLRPDGTPVQSQSVQVAVRPNMPNRHFLVCPVRGSTHERLFFRDGFFASAIAQRLRQRSQLT